MEDLNERSEYIGLEGSTYMFTLNDEYTVDSRTMGNSLRFANHSKSYANAYTKIVFAEGNHRICLFASESIKKNDEIFFDYDGQNILCEKYDWINDNTKLPIHQKKHLKANKSANGNIIKKKKLRGINGYGTGTHFPLKKHNDSDDEIKMGRKRKRSEDSRSEISQEDESESNDSGVKKDIEEAKALIKDYFENFKKIYGF